MKTFLKKIFIQKKFNFHAHTSGELIQCVKYWSHKVSLIELQSLPLPSFFLSFNVIFITLQQNKCTQFMFLKAQILMLQKKCHLLSLTEHIPSILLVSDRSPSPFNFFLRNIFLSTPHQNQVPSIPPVGNLYITDALQKYCLVTAFSVE